MYIGFYYQTINFTFWWCHWLWNQFFCRWGYQQYNHIYYHIKIFNRKEIIPSVNYELWIIYIWYGNDWSCLESKSSNNIHRPGVCSPFMCRTCRSKSSIIYMYIYAYSQINRCALKIKLFYINRKLQSFIVWLLFQLIVKI